MLARLGLQRDRLQPAAKGLQRGQALLDAAPLANTPAAFARQIADEVAKNRRVAKEAHIKLE